jgi:hypothetical protein
VKPAVDEAVADVVEPRGCHQEVAVLRGDCAGDRLRSFGDSHDVTPPVTCLVEHSARLVLGRSWLG